MADSKKRSIGEIVGSIRKRYGESSIARASESPALSLERIPSGIYGIDKLLEGGWPLGRIVQIYGKESGGKTSTLLHSIANAQRYCRSCLKVRPDRKFYDGEPTCDCKKPKDFETIWLDVEGCISGDSEMFNTKTGESLTVEEAYNTKDSWVSNVLDVDNGKLLDRHVERKCCVGEKDIIRIKTHTTSIGLTPNHKVYAWKTGEVAPEWVCAGAL